MQNEIVARSDTLGLVGVVVIAFMLGVTVTILLIRLKNARRDSSRDDIQ